MAKVLIADDHAVTRAGLRQLLEAEPRVEYIGEAAGGAEALDAIRRETWDLLILDLHMPGLGGLDLLPNIRQHAPSVKILIVSGLPEEMYARTVLRAGAAGFVSKGCDADELLQAVRCVLAGHHYVSESATQVLLGDLNFDPKQPPHTRLSGQESVVFCKLAQGLKVTSIAKDLSLSPKTVSTYRSRIFEKMNFTSNADIAAYALRHGLVQ
jgi:two-component system invasion response regulator UvrY